MFREVSAAHSRCQGGVSCWLQRDQVGTQAGTQPREVQWRPCLGLPFTSDWEQVAEGRADRERGMFPVSLVIIAGCLMQMELTSLVTEGC